MKCLFLKCPIDKLSVYEMFYLRNVLSMKCPLDEMSFYEMFQRQFHVTLDAKMVMPDLQC